MSSEKHFSLPRRLIEALLADVLGIEIGLGSIQKASEEVSQAVEQPVSAIAGAVAARSGPECG
jgi:hypothetical protein